MILLTPAFAGAVASLFSSDSRNVKAFSGILCLVSCVAGIAAFSTVGELSSRVYLLPVGPAFGEYRVLFDDLSALSITASSVVYLLVAAHMMSRKDNYSCRFYGLVNTLYISIVLAMCADSVILLLIAWEMVSLTTFLMSYGNDELHRWRYFAITHFGGLVITGVFVSMWYVSGTGTLSAMEPLVSVAGNVTASCMILLLFMGFGTKLGLMPFHAWMPDLYNSSPVHSVALLSTVCSNVAILLLVKSSFLWIGIPNSAILPLVILLMASVTAIWGAMESLIQIEPRRILAYSSMENMAMVVMCLVIAMLFYQMELDDSLFVMILVAGLLHTINHSFFKSLMLLNIGTVESSTGEHLIDRMGGLAKTMPLMSLFALIGTLSMAAVPPLNGFVSEWLMIKTVISAGVGTSQITVVLPLIITALGICGSMAAVSYARLFGFIFLGRPRSDSFRHPEKPGWGSMAPLCALAICCVALGVLAVPIIESLTVSMCETLGIHYELRSIVARSLNPVVIVLMLAGICIIVAALFRVFGKNKAEVTTWDCGTELTEDMQYTSIGFTQPLVRVFHPIYGDSFEIIDNITNETYRIRFQEPTIKYFLAPLGRSVKWITGQICRIQTGNIQSYIAYILIMLIAVLLGVRLI